jgi:hypothetical protein
VYQNKKKMKEFGVNEELTEKEKKKKKLQKVIDATAIDLEKTAPLTNIDDGVIQCKCPFGDPSLTTSFWAK